MSRHILVVDDESGIRESLSIGLSREGYEVSTASDAESALAAVSRAHPDLALVDVRMPGCDGSAAPRHQVPASLTPAGLWVMRQFLDLGIPVVMISGNATLQEAVQAVKEGAFDFLEKPISIDKVLVTISRALDYESIKDRVTVLTERQTGPREPLGVAPAWRSVMDVAAKVAPTDAVVLIEGESGTGKEVVAEWIHAKSARAAGPFVPVNVAALPESLVESELFGHEKGAFTGAASGKKGKFELASGGTLFLDEIGEMPVSIQPKLLRALENGEIQRLGGERIRRVDTRIVAATNRNLREAVSAGSFREDLFFRLNVVPLRLPPLRDRAGDVDLLADLFIRDFGRRYRKPDLAWTAAARELLRKASWRGNVRELRNLCERAAILCESEIPASLLENILGIGTETAEEAGELRGKLDRYEAGLLKETIAAAGGNLTAAADRLGISRSQLYRKLERLGIKPG